MNIDAKKESLIQRLRARQDRPDEENQANPPKHVKRLGGKIRQKSYRDEIEQDLDDAFEPILAVAELARVMGHRDFAYPRAHQVGERRDEAVHFAVEPGALENLGAISLDRATGI